MKKIALLGIIACLSTASVAAEDFTPQIEASRSLIKAFVAELSGELKGAMGNGGPVEAIKVCNVKAMGITQKHAEKNGIQLRRTSLKPRNPANTPDAWETAVLKQFETRQAAGEDLKKMEYYEVVIQGEKAVFRYMKAIPTAQKPCLACHGSDINPAIENLLDKHYPTDKARGYKVGDIRGAFTIIQPMAETIPNSSNEPLELQRIMLDMGKEMQNITAAILSENWGQVEKSASFIADHPKPPMSERKRIMKFLGTEMAKFKESDMKTHSAARELAKIAKRQDGRAVISQFSTLQHTCLTCHEVYRKKLRDHFYSQY